MVIVFFLVAFLASVVGAICGIGGGVVIKPVLDMLHLGSSATINFLSGCTVLSMSLYSVGKSLNDKVRGIDIAFGTPIALGAALGGVLGKQLFSFVQAMFENKAMVGGVQAVSLGVITVGTLVYTLYKSRISPKQITGKIFRGLIGLALGVMSSFLGIGGGPINLAVLGYCFSMDTKTAAANSLYIIMLSQLTSLLSTVLTASVPTFSMPALFFMVTGGIGGGIVGRSLNGKMDYKSVDKLFIALMIVIVGICVYNSTTAFIIASPL